MSKPNLKWLLNVLTHHLHQEQNERWRYEYQECINWIKETHPELAEDENKKIKKQIIGLVNKMNIPNKDKERFISNLENYKIQSTADLENDLCDLQDQHNDQTKEYRVLGEAIEFIRRTKSPWKPTKSQIDSLDCAIDALSDDGPLSTLYEDLKKLI
jgi:uncharacterized protein YhaN